MNIISVLVDKIRLPIYNFEVDEYFEDSRFKKVKIWIAHTGENLNGSVFTKDSLELMSNTLPYTPIVGYIHKDDEGVEDFKGHEMLIRIKDGDIEFEYLGVPFGFVPENSESKIELRDGKEWLTCEAYLWTKFEKCIDLFMESNGKKSQSMEIDNLNGFIDDLGRFNIEDARFSALCILGDNVPPAMKGSTVEFFSRDLMNQEIKNMIAEFSKKGESNLEDHKEVVEEVAVEEFENDEHNPVEEETEIVTENNAEETDGEDSDVTIDDVADTEDASNEQADVEEQVEESSEEKYQINFSYSFEDLRGMIYATLRNQHEDNYVWIVQTFSDEFVYQLEEYNNGDYDISFYRCKYQVDGNDIVISNKEQVYSMFLNEFEKNEVESARERVKELEAELSDLREFKQSQEQGEKIDLIESYSADLTVEDKERLVEFAKEVDLESLEKEIVFTIYKQNKDINKKENQAVFAYVVPESEADKKYGELGRYFR